MSDRHSLLQPGVYACDECITELGESADIPVVSKDFRGLCSLHPENDKFTITGTVELFSGKISDTLNLHPQQLPENTDEVVLVMPGTVEVS